jgi:hypothetical protein
MSILAPVGYAYPHQPRATGAKTLIVHVAKQVFTLREMRKETAP